MPATIIKPISPPASTPFEVVLHTSIYNGNFPEDVQSLLRLLRLPLPQDLVDEGQLLPRLSPAVRQLYLDEMCSLPTTLEAEKKFKRPGTSVSGIMDVVLTCTQVASDARRCVHGLSERRRCWSALVAACVLGMQGIAHLSEDIPVTISRIKPRTEGVVLEDLERTAFTMLSCWIARKHRMKEESSLEHSETSVSDYSLVLTDNASDASSESFMTLDYPFDAYVTPGTGKRVDCRFPVVCVGDEDDIQNLVTSIVCQRHVWGLPTTVVGVSVPKEGTHASLVFAWLEMNAASVDGCPVVHIALPEKPASSHLPLGFFDAADASSALRFAQFILDLEPRFSTIKDFLRNPTLKDFCWQAEHVHFHDQISKPESLFSSSRLAEWLESLPNAEPPDLDPLHFNDRRSSTMANLPKKQHSVASSSTSNSLIVPTIHTLEGDGRSKRSKSKGQDDPGLPAFSKLSRSRYGCSDYAMIGEDHPQGIRTYLTDRRTIPLLVIKRANPLLILEEQINEFVDLYENVTRFSWPESWNKLSSLPPCDKTLERFRLKLLDNYQLYQEQQMPVELVDNQDFAIFSIAERMSTFLYIVAQAELTEHNLGDGIVIESGTRAPWDLAMKTGRCDDPATPLLRAFFVERQIRLATNQAASEGPLFKRGDFATLVNILTSNQSTAVFAAGSSRELYRMAKREADASFRLFESKQGGKDNVQVIVTPDDRKYEPYQGVVDGMYCLHYDPQLTKGQEEVMVTQSTPTWSDRFRQLFYSSSKSPNNKCGVHNVQQSTTQDLQSQESTTTKNTRASCLCTEVTRLSYEAPVSLRTVESKKVIFVPMIFSEYKRSSKTIHQAFNQVRMYCIAGAEFLASLGLLDFPVWGIVAAGNQGGIVMAWKSSLSWTQKTTKERVRTHAQATEPHCNMIFDRNIKRFDLSDPLQAFHFLTCIHRIHRRQSLLEEKLNVLSVIDKLQSPDYTSWMSVIPPKEPTSTSGATAKVEKKG